jgi:hypothetical protein
VGGAHVTASQGSHGRGQVGHFLPRLPHPAAHQPFRLPQEGTGKNYREFTVMTVLQYNCCVSGSGLFGQILSFNKTKSRSDINIAASSRLGNYLLKQVFKYQYLPLYVYVVSQFFGKVFGILSGIQIR